MFPILRKKNIEQHMAAALDEYQEEQKEAVDAVSRSGYQLRDLSRNFLQCLGESGLISTGKLMHYTADLIASGGLTVWQRLLWDYVYDHIGVASPRIFLYLTRKFRALNDAARKVAFDVFCKTHEVQEMVMEVVLIVQGCPKKSKVKFPTVHEGTHENDTWLREVLRTTDKASVRRVWNRSTDLEPMLHAGNEMVFAITEGAPERALYWVKWLMEEDRILRKKYGQGLSTAERGPAHLSAAQRTSMGYYLIMILAEAYKEFAEKGAIRMNEEFQTLLDIYRSPDSVHSQKRKMDTIAIMVQILTDVPRQKVPAAPALHSDPAQLQRMVGQAGRFFQEVMAHPVPAKLLPDKVKGISQKRAKEPSKEEQLKRQLEMTDQLLMSFYKM